MCWKHLLTARIPRVSVERQQSGELLEGRAIVSGSPPPHPRKPPTPGPDPRLRQASICFVATKQHCFRFLERGLCRSRSFGGAGGEENKLIASTFLQSSQISCEPIPSLYVCFSSFIKDCGQLALYFEINNRMYASFLTITQGQCLKLHIFHK